jgi:hypothetical protein
MTEIGFKPASTLSRGIDKARTVPSQRLEECTRVAAVLGAGTLVSGVERAVPPVRPEVRPIPQCHQPEHAHPDAHFARRTIALQQVQFLETFENPEGEIDIDTERIKNLALKLERRSFA